MDNMASQISSIRRANSKSSRAFTLVEVMVGAALSSLVLAGVISTFLLMGRTGTNLANYSEAEASGRNALENFSREAHQAYSVEAYSSTSVTLGIPDNTINRTPANPTANGAYLVTYTFDSVNKTLTRAVNGGTAEPVVTGVEQIPSIPFINYYKYVTAGTNPPTGSGYQDAVGTNTAGNVGEIKQIEFSFLIKRKSVTVATASNKVISARFILRNK
jgi:type II secretory pathway pseudopilin PulG